MSREEQLEWEARWARPAAAAAFGAALFLVAGFATLVASLSSTPGGGDRQRLLEIDSHVPQLVTISALDALAVALMIGPLLYLFGATRPRRPEIPAAARLLAVVGPLLYAALRLALTFVQIDIAGDFAALPAGFQTDEIGERLLSDSALGTVQLMGLGASLALGFPFVLIALSAMRAGLLSRFIGVLGIIVGVLYVIPLLGGGPPVVAIFWLGALAALFLDRWPGGRGPAWASGEAVPWPSAMEVAKMREAQAQGTEAEEPSAAKPRRKKRR